LPCVAGTRAGCAQATEPDFDIAIESATTKTDHEKIARKGTSMDNAKNSLHLDASGHWFFSRGTLVACVVLGTAGILLATGHEAHLLGALPYLLLLACPLMHIFMHGGHHEHHGTSRRNPTDDNTSIPQDAEPMEKS
jgi:Protein of unknown function (DUF2933)